MPVQFKLGDKVIVRSWPHMDKWVPAIYAYYDEGAASCDAEPHVVFGGRQFKYCLPLEGNEILIGRNGDSVEQPDYVEPPSDKTYKFLEEVKVNVTGGDDGWECGWYVSFSGIDGDPSPHQILVHLSEDGGHYSLGRYMDEEVRHIDD